MNTNNDLTNTTTTTVTDGYATTATQSTNKHQLINILTYALPLSCLAILAIVMIVIGIRQRHKVLDKWTSLKRMRNTNPKFLQSVGLRRDSEFDSFNHDYDKATPRSQTSTLHHERQYHLATIS